ncbi:hypothetical protein Egran_06100, partial [Elaphomyces granulatus]
RSELKYYNPSILFIAPEALRRGSDTPETVRSLILQFERCIYPSAIIPIELKGRLEEELRKSNVVPSYAYDHDSKKSPADVERLWEEVKILFRQAARCRSPAAHEANIPTIQLTLSQYNLSHVIGIKTKRFCQISPQTLLPTNDAGIPVQVKKINYVLTLKSDDDRAESAFEKMENPAECSLNQTTDDFHRRSLIAVNIEVKREHGIDPLVQLGIWSAAGFKKRKLNGDDDEAFPMPGLTVVGHVWELYIAFMNEKEQVALLGPFHIGCTDTYFGIFQIIASLTALAEWVSKRLSGVGGTRYLAKT